MNKKSDNNSTFAERNAGKILAGAFAISGVGSFLINVSGAPVGFMVAPAVIGVVLLLVAIGGYSARRKREAI